MHSNDYAIKAQIQCVWNDSFQLDLDVELASHKVTAIFGPSGSGKTTILRCLAGFSPCKGLIIVNGHVWQNEHKTLETHRRTLAYVFQEPSLFSHLTVKENLLFAQKRARRKKAIVNFDELIPLMQLTTLLDQFPYQLSGGEKQRVAIARALLAQPDILLMDEPLAALDGKRKLDILRYLQTLQKRFHLTVIYVSHSISEIAQIADDVLVLESGKVISKGPVTDIFSQMEVVKKEFQQASSVILGQVVSVDAEHFLAKIRCRCGVFWVANDQLTMGESIRLHLLASDVSVALTQPSQSSILNVIESTVAEIDFQVDSPYVFVALANNGDRFLAKITRKSLSHLGLVVGQQVWAQVKSVAISH